MGGFVYEGDFKNNTYNGTGKESQLVEGGTETYEGDFVNGK